MMNKQINFLIGLPRAGNTLFASIMNQNPKIAATPNSIVNEICRYTEKIKRGEQFLNFPYSDSLDNVLSNIFSNYYQNWNYDYIIDRGPWGAPPNLNFLKNYLGQEIKIIILVRDLKEVLASFLKHSYEHPDSFVNKGWAKTDEEKCDMLMSKEGIIVTELIGIHHLTQLDRNKKYAHLIEYNNLVDKPKETIDGVYKFLDIPPFEHHFDKFEQLSVQGQYIDDTVVGKGLHTIKENGLIKTKHNPLPQKVLDNFEEKLNLWR